MKYNFNKAEINLASIFFYLYFLIFSVINFHKNISVYFLRASKMKCVQGSFFSQKLIHFTCFAETWQLMVHNWKGLTSHIRKRLDIFVGILWRQVCVTQYLLWLQAIYVCLFQYVFVLNICVYFYSSHRQTLTKSFGHDYWMSFFI